MDLRSDMNRTMLKHRPLFCVFDGYCPCRGVYTECVQSVAESENYLAAQVQRSTSKQIDGPIIALHLFTFLFSSTSIHVTEFRFVLLCIVDTGLRGTGSGCRSQTLPLE